MKQAIAGVAPATEKEVTVMTVWPSIAKFGLGRWMGQMFSIRAGFYIFTVGNLLALTMGIPLGLALYFLRIPIRYRLTNRRIVVEQGPKAEELRSVGLDRYDSIEILVRSGQGWYDAGDLIFRQGTLETFRLEGVSRPGAFRSTCMKARLGYVGVKEALERQSA